VINKKKLIKFNLATTLAIVALIVAIAGFFIAPWVQQKFFPKKTIIYLPEGTGIKTIQPPISEKKQSIKPSKNKIIHKKFPKISSPDNKIEIPASPPGETKRTTLETTSGLKIEIENKAPDRFKTIY